MTNASGAFWFVGDLQAILRVARSQPLPQHSGLETIVAHEQQRTDEHLNVIPSQPLDVPPEQILQAIHLIRGRKILLDADLAELYGVQTGALTRAVRRNIDRFPADFMFQLSEEEFAILRRQSGISSQWGGRRYPPYAFTEQGVAMLSSVLRSPRAVRVNIEIMRAFVRLRNALTTHESLAKKLEELEDKVGTHDEALRSVVIAVRQLMAPAPGTPKTGFEESEEKQ